MSTAAEDLTCPSAPIASGATLLGLVGPDGTVGYLTPSITVDQEFVDAASRGGLPGKRFRFAAQCLESGCAQWTGSRCGLIDTLIAADDLAPDEEPERLPRCAIRSSCRWFAQAGSEACAICPIVITDCR
jgi:hypothetical protein